MRVQSHPSEGEISFSDGAFSCLFWGNRLSLTGGLYGNSSFGRKYLEMEIRIHRRFPLSKQTFFSIATTKQSRSVSLVISCSEEFYINLYWGSGRPILLAEQTYIGHRDEQYCSALQVILGLPREQYSFLWQLTVRGSVTTPVFRLKRRRYSGGTLDGVCIFSTDPEGGVRPMSICHPIYKRKSSRNPASAITNM